jgi:uncharacterized membrane protein YdjX (TVP38/TMEM64 family)
VGEVLKQDMTDALFQGTAALRDAGFAGFLLLTFSFAVAAVLFIPRHLVCIASGWAIGLAGIGPALIGTTAGSAVAFLLARHLFRGRLSRVIGHHPTYTATIEAIQVEGWRTVTLMRLAAPIPGPLLSYLCGITGMPLLVFSTATLIGIAPQVVLYVYIGAVGGAASRNQGGELGIWLGIAGAALTATAVTLVVRRTRLLLSRPSRSGTVTAPDR